MMTVMLCLGVLLCIDRANRRTSAYRHIGGGLLGGPERSGGSARRWVRCGRAFDEPRRGGGRPEARRGRPELAFRQGFQRRIFVLTPARRSATRPAPDRIGPCRNGNGRIAPLVEQLTLNHNRKSTRLNSSPH